MKKILTLTVKDDLHTKKVSEILKDRYDEDLIELNREDYEREWVISVLSRKTGPKVILTYKNTEYHEEDIGAIWNRRPFYMATAQDKIDPIERYIHSQTAIHVNSAFRLLGSNKYCMNSPESDWKANSKCVQSMFAFECGLLIPDTYQGGSPNLLYEFSKSINEKLCIKPIESTHIKIDENTTLAHYTKIFENRSLEDLHSVKECPVIIQKYIEKDYEIRVTIVGKKLFPSLIDTKKASKEAQIDFRHYDWANTPYYPITLPDEINKKLLLLMNKLGLEYGAIDLIKNQNDQYYFLEVNSQGQWLWVEDMTGLKISEEVASCLWRQL